MSFSEDFIVPDTVEFEIEQELKGLAKERMRAEFVTDEEAGLAWLKLKTEIYAERVDERSKTIVFSSPKTWWDMFKIEYFPAALLRKYPPKYDTQEKTVTFVARAVFPRLSLILPPEENVFIIQTDVQEE